MFLSLTNYCSFFPSRHKLLSGLTSAVTAAVNMPCWSHGKAGARKLRCHKKSWGWGFERNMPLIVGIGEVKCAVLTTVTDL